MAMADWSIFNVDWVCLPVNVFTELDCVVRPIEYYYDAIVYRCCMCTSVFRFRCIFTNNVFQYAVVNTIIWSVNSRNQCCSKSASGCSPPFTEVDYVVITIDIDDCNVAIVYLYCNCVDDLLTISLCCKILFSCMLVSHCSISYCCDCNGLWRYQIWLTAASGHEQVELHWYKLSQWTRNKIVMRR